MKTKKTDFDVLEAIRKIRKKHHEETKNMTFKEQGAYYHKGSVALRAKMARMNYKDGRKDFPFLFHDSGNEEKNATQKKR